MNSAITRVSIIVPPCRRATSNNAKIEFRRCARMRGRGERTEGAQLVSADRRSRQVQCLETPRRRGRLTRRGRVIVAPAPVRSLRSCRSGDCCRALCSRRNVAPRCRESVYAYAARCARSCERVRVAVEHRAVTHGFHVIAFSLATPRFS